MGTERLFIAANISESQRSQVAQLVAALQKGVQFTKAHPKWVAIGNMHLTLQFLGDVETQKIPLIIERVEEALSPLPPFDLSLARLGVFPDEKQPRVLWLGVDAGKAQITRISERVQAACATLGFPTEKRAYHPHLTLARIHSLRGVAAFMDVVHSHQAARCGKTPVDHLSLFRSELQPEGARYTELHRWSFAQAAGGPDDAS